MNYLTEGKDDRRPFQSRNGHLSMAHVKLLMKKYDKDHLYKIIHHLHYHHILNKIEIAKLNGEIRQEKIREHNLIKHIEVKQQKIDGLDEEIDKERELTWLMWKKTNTQE